MFENDTVNRWVFRRLWKVSSDGTDVQLNSTMRLISGTLHSTPLPWLPVLSNIEPPALRRKAATDKLVEKIVKHDSWPIQPDILSPPLLRLTSRKPLWLDLQPVDIKSRWRQYYTILLTYGILYFYQFLGLVDIGHIFTSLQLFRAFHSRLREWRDVSWLECTVLSRAFDLESYGTLLVWESCCLVTVDLTLVCQLHGTCVTFSWVVSFLELFILYLANDGTRLDWNVLSCSGRQTYRHEAVPNA